MLAYQTAYLKANYPWHFAAALLTIEAQNTDKLALYLGECRDRGIPILPPDINESQLAFTVEPERGVRFGLTAIKNVGEGAIESLLSVRAKQGRIQSIHALCEDLDLRLVNKRVFESLVKAGAFDSLGGDDAQLRRRWRRASCGRGFSPRSMPRASTARGSARPRTRGRRSCSAALATGVRRRGTATRMALPAAPPWSESEQLGFEKETLGLYWSGHPVDRLCERAAGLRCPFDRGARRRAGRAARKMMRGDPADGSRSSPTPASAASSRPAASSRRARAIAWRCSRSKTPRAASRSIAFPEAYQRAASLIETGTLVLVRGKLERDDESVRVLASEIVPIEAVHERLAREVKIRIRQPGGIGRAGAARDRQPPPRRPAPLVRDRDRRAASARVARRHRADPRHGRRRR